MRKIPPAVLWCSVLSLGLLLTACTPKDPQEQVAEIRGQYEVKLNAWNVVEPEEPALMAAEEMDPGTASASAMAAAEEVAEEAEEGEELDEYEPPPSGPRPTDILFDVLVRFAGTDPLPGLTLEITRADPFGEEKDSFLYWLETGPMAKSELRQVDFEIEDLEFEEGDQFSVTLESYVPPEERGEYREFAEAAP